METLILDRLAVGGQYDPQDLGTLAHLTVLESIAALADIQSDLQTSVLGVRLESELRQLWDTAAIFEESVSAGATDARTSGQHADAIQRDATRPIKMSMRP